ncbi:MAG: hypothetical protein HYU66_25025 [Armatimonadetes bacterium]|nr:hypothetical protein [Armatimonadota bacterium]
MIPEVVYARPVLRPLADTLAAGAPLALEVAVENPTPHALEGASAELTLEVERGVLISWQIPIEPVPARGRRVVAVDRAEPAWALPLNVAQGVGRFRIALFRADGAYLNEDRCEVLVQT